MEYIKPRHRKVIYEIDKKTIKNFHLLVEERRQLRIGKVKSILASLEKGIHFESDIVVNKINGDYRVIDGNHRIEAISELLKREPETRVKVYLAKYENLSLYQEKKIRIEKIRDEERRIYSVWNKGTPENATDYLQQYFKIIPCGEEMLRKLPATIYSTDKTMSLKLLVGSHVTAKAQKKFEGGYANGGEKTVEDFKAVESGDITIMKAFCDDMEEIFGKFYKQSPYYRTTVISSFYRIWYDNKKQMPRQKFIDVFKAVFLDKWAEVNELSAHGGRSATQTFYRLSLDRLNSYRKKLYFLSDKDVLEKQEDKSLSGKNGTVPNLTQADSIESVA